MNKKQLSPEEMRVYNRLRHNIGKTMKFDGNVFGHKKWPETEFKCLEIKVYTIDFLDIKTMKPKANIGAKFLLVNDNMKKAQWTISFPIQLEES